MTAGDVESVDGVPDLYYVDTGMYEVDEYGSVYLIDTDRPAIVDTGIGADYETITAALDEVGIGEEDLEYVLPTHVHLDHANGAGYFARDYPNATVLTHERGVPHLIDPSRLVEGTKEAVGDQWRFYTEPEPVPEDRIEGLTEGDEVDLGDRTLVVHEAPGHAPHQVVFHDDGTRADGDDVDGVVFTGDAAGIYVPKADAVRETTPPPQFHLDKARRDAETVAALEPDVLAFGHFGPRAFEERLLSGYKRTLFEWVEAVRRKREELADDDAVIEHFVAHADEMVGADQWGERKAEAEARLNTRGVLAYLDYAESE